MGAYLLLNRLKYPNDAATGVIQSGHRYPRSSSEPEAGSALKLDIAYLYASLQNKERR